MTTPKYVFKLISYHTAEVLKATPGVAMTQCLRITYNSSLYGETLPLLWGRKTRLLRSLMTCSGVCKSQLPSVLVASELFCTQTVTAYRMDLHLLKLISIFPPVCLPVGGNIISFSQGLLI